MIAFLSKVVAESLLSLYPVFVKNIPVAFNLQLWSRFFSYVAISSLFIDYKFVATTLFSKIGLLLAGVTLIHIYTSYKGFQALESGPAYTLFYIYPILILLMSGYSVPLLAGLVVLGGWLLTRRIKSIYGVVMVALAALTEASIYFIVKRIKTPNSWNHVFLSYAAGAVLLSGLFFHQIKTIQLTDSLSLSLGLNGVLGLAGYVLRFYSVSRLTPFLYALLSNVGIVMSYVYGFFINGETITWMDALGALCIMVACSMAKKVK
jgi:drug/metabolite transporter (DMT)-like permease